MMDKEDLIKIGLSFERELVALTRFYRDLGEAISLEQGAVGSSDFEALEKNLAQKETLGGLILKSSEHLMTLSRKVESLGRPLLGQDFHASGLSQLLKALKELSLREEASFKSSVLDHLLIKIDEKLADFLLVFKDVKPKVEQNKYLVGKLLHRHRENIRIFQETISEAEGTYDKGGETTSRHSRSVIQVKA